MLQWKRSDSGCLYRAFTSGRVYQIILHADGRWQLRVRDREEPMDVPLDDLWVTLNWYRDPAVAGIEANYHEEKVAA
jgi:hypothetical protein